MVCDNVWCCIVENRTVPELVVLIGLQATWSCQCGIHFVDLHARGSRTASGSGRPIEGNPRPARQAYSRSETEGPCPKIRVRSACQGTTTAARAFSGQHVAHFGSYHPKAVALWVGAWIAEGREMRNPAEHHANSRFGDFRPIRLTKKAIGCTNGCKTLF